MAQPPNPRHVPGPVERRHPNDGSNRVGRRSPRLTRRRATILRVLGAAAWFLLLIAWVVFLRPQSLGGPMAYVYVSGNSMFPTLEQGDLVLVGHATQYEPGDVVAYRVPEGQAAEGYIVIHRVVTRTQDGLVTRGDNATGPDFWRPKSEDMVGRMWLRLPRMGRVLAILANPLVLAGLAFGTTVTLVLKRPFARSAVD